MKAVQHTSGGKEHPIKGGSKEIRRAQWARPVIVKRPTRAGLQLSVVEQTSKRVVDWWW